MFYISTTEPLFGSVINYSSSRILSLYIVSRDDETVKLMIETISTHTPFFFYKRHDTLRHLDEFIEDLMYFYSYLYYISSSKC